MLFRSSQLPPHAEAPGTATGCWHLWDPTGLASPARAGVAGSLVLSALGHLGLALGMGPPTPPTLPTVAREPGPGSERQRADGHLPPTEAGSPRLCVLSDPGGLSAQLSLLPAAPKVSWSPSWEQGGRKRSQKMGTPRRTRAQ